MERSWLKADQNMTKLMWDCKKRLENRYRYAPECYKLWNSFTELNLIEVAVKPNVRALPPAPLLAAMEKVDAAIRSKLFAKWSFSYLSNDAALGIPDRRLLSLYKYPQANEIQRSSAAYIGSAFAPDTKLLSLLNSPQLLTIERNPQTQGWTLARLTNYSESRYEDLFHPIAKFAPVLLYSSPYEQYVRALTGNLFPATCLHHRDSIKTFDGLFYSSDAMSVPASGSNSQNKYIQLAADCSSDRRFAVFYKPVAVESREVIVKVNGHVIRLIPRAVSSSGEQPVTFYVDGTEVTVNEGESKYIAAEHKWVFCKV